MIRELDDEIMKELRAVREAYARKFNYDIDKMFEDIRRQEALRLNKGLKSKAPKTSRGSKAVSKPRKRGRAA